ncbi:MAG: TerC family protein [Gemmatimonadota bacterium]
MAWITSPESWIALATLTLLEIILGVDNIVMISILSDKLPPDRREMARKVGLGMALFATMGAVLTQIVAMDLVFSLDSVITAVGVADEVGVMVTAIVVAMIVMMILIEPISRFVTRHPTVKILALSFLLLIGVTLVAEGLGQHFPKGYIYFAFGFSIFVEALNLRVRERRRVEPPGAAA